MLGGGEGEGQREREREAGSPPKSLSAINQDGRQTAPKELALSLCRL